MHGDNGREQAGDENVGAIVKSPPAGVVRVLLSAFLIGAVGLFFGIPSLCEPFGVDQGIYAYIAERLLEGAVDHRDVFDHKPPGIHAAYAAAFALFGHHMWAVRLMDLLAALATGACLAVFCRRIAAWRMAVACALLYVAYYESFFDWMSRAQPETWVNLAHVAGLALLVRATGWPATFAAGVMLGIGFWFKPTIIALFPLWVIVAVRGAMEGPVLDRRKLAVVAGAVAGGFLAMSAAVLLYYAITGALGDFYEAVVEFNLRYHVGAGLRGNWGRVGKALAFILKPLYALTILSLASLACAASPAKRRALAFGAIWLALAFGTVLWQGSTAKSHYVVVLAPLAFLASLALDGAIGAASLEKGGGGLWRPAALVASIAATCLVVVNVAGLFSPRWTKFVALASGAVSREQYDRSFWLKGGPQRGGYSFDDVRRIAAYLEDRTSPEETIFVWGFRPIIAYLAHRRMPTRFIFRYPLTRANKAKWWEEFLSDLERSPPAFFVVVLRDRGRYHPLTSKQALLRHGRLSAFVRQNYEPDRTMTDFEIYRLTGKRP